MKVDLVSISQPNIDGIKTAEEFISYCARVSNPPNQLNTNTAGGLLRYCIKHNHFSIFEMVNLVFEIETTRDIARQLLRHTHKFQEFSQRYADPTQFLHFERREARLQDPKNRQNSIVTDDEDLKRSWEMKQDQLIHEANLAYRWALAQGIAKEQARAVLPEGNTISRLYANGYIRTWIHYIDARTKEDTQLEHRILASQCADAIAPIFPMIKEVDHYG